MTNAFGTLNRVTTTIFDLLSVFFDELFDSVSGSKETAEKRSGKLVLNSLTPDSI